MSITLCTSEPLGTFSSDWNTLPVLHRYANVLLDGVVRGSEDGRPEFLLRSEKQSSCPFLVLDVFLALGREALPCSITCLRKSEAQPGAQIRIVRSLSDLGQGLVFQGFGTIPDLALNALGLHLSELMTQLTRVEREVLHTLRTLQYERAGDPRDLRSHGLQKRVAEKLGKSPVAIHKSLRSAKYGLMTQTLLAMSRISGC